MAADPRCIVGSMVEAKACHVTNLAECAHHYGSKNKTKRVQGIITHVEVIKKSTTNRTTTFVTAAYDLGGTMIRPCKLNIRSVKAVHSYSGNRPYRWWRIAGVNRQRFDDDGNFDATNSHITYVGGPIQHQHIFGTTYSGGGKGNTTLNY